MAAAPLIPVLAAIFTATTIVGSAIKGQQEAAHQKRAAASAEQAATANAAAEKRAVNKANAKTPDVAGLLFGNRSGSDTTNLTGSAGAPVGASSIGANTLLGQ